MTAPVVTEKLSQANVAWLKEFSVVMQRRYAYPAGHPARLAAEKTALAQIATALGCSIFFADPYRPNQRGTCENTIGLVRQYIPKGSCGHRLTPEQLQRIADKLNHRPRRCLGFKTPYEVKFASTPVALRT